MTAAGEPANKSDNKQAMKQPAASTDASVGVDAKRKTAIFLAVITLLMSLIMMLGPAVSLQQTVFLGKFDSVAFYFNLFIVLSYIIGIKTT